MNTDNRLLAKYKVTTINAHTIAYAVCSIIVIKLILYLIYQLRNRYVKLLELSQADDSVRDNSTRQYLTTHRHQDIANNSNNLTTRQLIAQSLMQTWRVRTHDIGDHDSNIHHPVNHSDSFLDESICKLKNERMALINIFLQYSVYKNEPHIHNQDHDYDWSSSVWKHEIENGILSSPTILECTICLDPYNTGDEVATCMVDGCNHHFHTECITLWFMQHDHCPLCRKCVIQNVASCT